jgi:beta-glucanase (GH16 family)
LKHVTFKNSFITASLILAGCGSSSRSDISTVIDNPVNLPPIISSSAVLTSSLDTEYNYTFSATDPNNDVITYSATTLPSWLSFDAAAGVLSGTPLFDEVGEHIVTLIASDSEGEAQQTFIITVLKTAVVTSYEGYTGEYAGFTLLIDDRFDEFDSEKWIKSTHTFIEQGCVLEQESVQFSQGIMNLVVNESNNAKGFSCAEIRSINRYGYGRIEARIKSPANEIASGYISSLFTYTFRPDGVNNDDTSAPIRWRELDIEMEGGRPNKFQANYIYGDDEWEWWKTRSWGAYEDKIDIGPISEWKVYALEWTPKFIKWYVDGQLMKVLLPEDLVAGTHNGKNSTSHTIDAHIPEYAMGLYMNFWIPNDAVQDSFGGNKVNNVYPMVTEYDWFRYYSLDGYEETIEGELPQ